jgi:hypothetical protein
MTISHFYSFFLQFIFIASAVGYTSVSYNGVTTTPGGEAFGWILIITLLVIMLGVAGYQIRKNGGVCIISCKKNFTEAQKAKKHKI